MKIHDITIGTAGHIDHGKSELIFRLTGIHPDRLKEEKERGMTIDLGYADYMTSTGRTVGFIDVPGHERLIKNMVAGAASIRLAVLVVAADDGVMPQTREHLNILTLLGIRSGLVALTKVDLVDEEMVELAREEIKGLVKGTFLEDAAVIPVSSSTGEGFDRFREVLDDAVDAVSPIEPSGAFRMPIQRVFSVKGFGTVVTGVPVNGRIRVGDPVQIFPSKVCGKIRNIQAFGRNRDEGRAGLRTAINISHVDYQTLSRGDTATTPDCFRTAAFMEAEFRFLKEWGFPLKNMTEVRVHTGTSEVMAGIVLLDRQILEPGETALVQLVLREPLVVAPGDPFILRLHSPMITIGGGRIVGVSPRKLKRFKKHIVDRVAAKRDGVADPKAQVLIEAESRREILFTPRELALALNGSPDRVDGAVNDLEASGDLVGVQQGMFMYKARFDSLADRVTSFLDEQHRLYPLMPFLDANPLKGLTGLDGREFLGVLKAMEDRGFLETAKGGLVRRTGFVPRPTSAQQAMTEGIEERIRASGAMPPTLAELLSEETESPEETESAIRFLIGSGRLIEVGAFLFHARILEQVWEVVKEMIERNGEVSFHEIRDRFKTTRKWMLPLMDYFDSCGLTCRVGKKRKLRHVKED